MNGAWKIVGAWLLVLSLLQGAAAEADPAGREVLRNGAVLVWQVEDGEPDAALGLAIPAFAQWSADGFGEPVTIRMTASSLATVDAWQFSFYRAGDEDLARPLRRFRGTALSLHEPLSWDGRVEDGPSLRPGERVIAVLEVRDVAGNIERTMPQEMLVARYRMRREIRRIDAVDSDRSEALREGAAPERSIIPMKGRAVALRLEDWPEEDPPLVSGLPMVRDNGAWVLRQNLPGGAYDLVVQVGRPLLDGIRAIPVGIARIDVPAGNPMRAAVKGVGAFERIDRQAGPLQPEDLSADGHLDGADAAQLVLTNRDLAEDRLALALIDPALPVPLGKDRRKRRSILIGQRTSTALWAGQGALTVPVRAPQNVATRQVSFTLSGALEASLALPHSDIVGGSLRIAFQDGSNNLMAGRDYLADHTEGRVLLRQSVLERKNEGDAPIGIFYQINAFAPRNSIPGSIAEMNRFSENVWDTKKSESIGDVDGKEDAGGLIERLFNWFKNQP